MCICLIHIQTEINTYYSWTFDRFIIIIFLDVNYQANTHQLSFFMTPEK